MAVNPDNKYKSSHVGSVIDEAVGYALNVPGIQSDVASLEAKVAPLNGVPAQLQAHISDIDNPHSVTKAQVGLGNVNNTSDMDKPISSATQTALDKKVDKVSGMGLSQNSYTTAEKNKLSGIESGAEVNVIESVKVNGSPLPVSGKAVNVDLSAYTQAIIYGACNTAGGTASKIITLTNAPTDWAQPYKYIFAIYYIASNATTAATAIISGTGYKYRYEESPLDDASLFVAGRTATISYYFIGDNKRLNWLGDTAATQAQFTNEEISALSDVCAKSGFTSSISAGGRTWSVTKIGYPNDSGAGTFAIATMTGYFSATPSDEATYNFTLPVAFVTPYANCFLSSYGTWKNWEQVGAYQLRLTSSTNAQLTLYTNQGGTKNFKITVMGTI